jgi:signal transduction histidine kinase
MFDLLNDILWARETAPARRSARELAEALLWLAESQLEVELATESGDESIKLRAAAEMLAARARELLPLADEPSQDLDVREALLGAVESVRAAAPFRRIDVSVEAEGRASLPPRLFGSSVRALLKNAFEHTPDGSQIEIRAVRRPQTGLDLEVRDRGVGMPAAQLHATRRGETETPDRTWYGTGRPLAFGAGGAGLDLLRLRTVGSSRGWTLEADSTLCPHVTADGRGCPGDAEQCGALRGDRSCASLEKGSLIRIRMP